MKSERTEPPGHAEWATADLFDSDPRQVAVCDLQFQSHGGVDVIAGPCVTLRAFDHAAVREALSKSGRGRILVVDQIQGQPRVAMLGDRLALLAQRNGWAGIIVNGAVRDTARLRTIELGVFANATTARRAKSDAARFERDVSFVIGGAEFSPGRWVVADADAVICCPEELFRALYG